VPKRDLLAGVAVDAPVADGVVVSTVVNPESK